jgi:non-heme chloroperoxidase
MSTIVTSDGTEIYYKDWGSGPVVTFSHGWPLSADAWDGQLQFLADNGYRAVAHDRRGHGRSSQPSNGNDMDTYADDLSALIEALDLRDATLVGHSTGGGEVARYIGRHGTSRVAKAALISAVPPIMIESDTNPEGLPIKVFDDIRAGVANDRSQFYKDLATPFTVPTCREPRCPREYSTSSGSGACSQGKRMRTNASRPSRKRTSERTSRSSTFRRSCSMVKMIRSSP